MQSVNYIDLWKLLDLLRNNIFMWYKWKIFQEVIIGNPNFFLHNIYSILIHLDCVGSKQA
jgi:hypothetical protein